MRRKALVLTVMVVGIALLFWAGWHNLRERRLAVQKAAETHVVLQPESGGQGGEEAGAKLKGKAAPGFSLVDVAGKKVALSDYKGRPVMVNFWGTWCAPCKEEMPWLEEFRGKYAAQGFEVLGIAEEDAGKDLVAKTAHKVGVTYPILLPDAKVASAYGGVDFLPQSFYVDKNGVVVEYTAGLGPGGKDEIEANIKKTIAAGGQ